MATATSNQQFIEQVLSEVIRPGAAQLKESRNFTDLRDGSLTTRRIQGWALQHYWFNQTLIKGYALRMVRSADNDEAFGAARRFAARFSFWRCFSTRVAAVPTNSHLTGNLRSKIQLIHYLISFSVNHVKLQIVDHLVELNYPIKRDTAWLGHSDIGSKNLFSK